MISAVNLGLVVLFLCVLLAPLLVRKVEENLEVFLFASGIVAMTISGFARVPDLATGWRWEIIREALIAPVRIATVFGIPVGIVQIVLIAGLVMYFLSARIERTVMRVEKRVPLPVIMFVMTTVCGLLSSIFSAIITAILLVELMSILPLRRTEIVKMTVIICFSIGLGAALTPLGEPLSTITIEKLAGFPYYAGFWYLLSTIGYLVLPGILALAVLGMMVMRRSPAETAPEPPRQYRETLREVCIRAAKVYLFIVALVLLGEGFAPFIVAYIHLMPAALLFWFNAVSAVLDNATLASAEISPVLTPLQIKSALMGLLAAGVMLVPGNIPNIIAAGKLKISSKEWARTGVPLGLLAMGIYFIAIFIPEL